MGRRGLSSRHPPTPPEPVYRPDQIERTAVQVRLLKDPRNVVHTLDGTLHLERRIVAYRTRCGRSLPTYEREAVLTTDEVTCSECQGTALSGRGRTVAGR